MNRLRKFVIAVVLFILLRSAMLMIAKADNITSMQVEGGTQYTIFVPDAPMCSERMEIIRELRRLIFEVQGLYCSVTIRNNRNILPFVGNGGR